jgi:hypothetical protein
MTKMRYFRATGVFFAQGYLYCRWNLKAYGGIIFAIGSE